MSDVPVPLAQPPSPRPRRIAPPSWLDVRLVLGVALVLASVLAGAKIVAGARENYPRVAARHDLAVGTILTARDVVLARVQLPGRGHGVYLDDVARAVGRELSRPMSAGELLPADALAHAATQTTMTVPLAAGSAPDLRKGQRIELWVSATSCSSLVLLPDVAVQAVRADTGGSFTSGSGGQDVVISVPPPLADRVVRALALDQAQLRAGVLTGRPVPAGPLPALATCTPPR